MVAIRATFDGEKIILPAGLRLRVGLPTAVPVTVQFPDNAIAELDPAAAAAVEKYKGYTTIWDFLNDDYRPTVSSEDRFRQLDEDRNTWGDPHDDPGAKP